jgi:hypothetical protein
LVLLVTVITIIIVRFEGHSAMKIAMFVLRVVMLSGSFKGPLSECSLYFSKIKEHLMGLSVSLFVISFMYPLQRPLPRNWATPRAYPRDEANRWGGIGGCTARVLTPRVCVSGAVLLQALLPLGLLLFGWGLTYNVFPAKAFPSLGWNPLCFCHLSSFLYFLFVNYFTSVFSYSEYIASNERMISEC